MGLEGIVSKRRDSFDGREMNTALNTFRDVIPLWA
jgi:hypothetical protein